MASDCSKGAGFVVNVALGTNNKSINQSINQLCVMRVAHNSLRLTNPWPSNSRSNWNLETNVDFLIKSLITAYLLGVADQFVAT